MVSPGQRREGDIQHRRALAVIGKRHVVEFDQAVHAAGIDRVRRLAHVRFGVEDVEEFPQPRRVHEHLVDEADEFLELADQQAGEIHEHHDVADGGAALEMQRYAGHEDSQHGQRGGRPGQHRDHGPPRQHRDLRREQIVGDGAQPRDLRLDAGEALHQGDIAERIGGALGEVGIVPLDGALQRLRLVDDEGGQDTEHDGHRDHHQPERPVQVERERQQHHEGSARRERVAEEVEPQHPQRSRSPPASPSSGGRNAIRRETSAAIAAHGRKNRSAPPGGGDGRGGRQTARRSRPPRW